MDRQLIPFACIIAYLWYNSFQGIWRPRPFRILVGVIGGLSGIAMTYVLYVIYILERTGPNGFTIEDIIVLMLLLFGPGLISVAVNAARGNYPIAKASELNDGNGNKN